MEKEKFVRGSFVLDENVEDTDTYYEEHKAKIDSIIEWANRMGIYVGFGISESRNYLCEYEVTGQTTRMCKGVASELKALLKPEWKKVRMSYQVEGHKI